MALFICYDYGGVTVDICWSFSLALTHFGFIEMFNITLAHRFQSLLPMNWIAETFFFSKTLRIYCNPNEYFVLSNKIEKIEKQM